MELIRTVTPYRVFWAGLLLRCVASLFFEPAAQQEWFMPFWNAYLEHPSLIPWDVAALLDDAVFPYGPMMFLTILPFAAIGLPVGFASGIAPGVVAVKGAILAADVAILLILVRLFPRQQFKVLIFYWLSPIVLLANYWAGQLDAVPVAWLMASCLALRHHRFCLAALLLAAAVSAKLSMAVVLPFFFVYLYRNKRFSEFRLQFCVLVGLGLLLGLGLPLLAESYRSTVLGTPEMHRLFDLHLYLGNMPIFLTPIFYGCILYLTWRIPRVTFELFLSLTGCSLLIILLATRTPPGWYLWFVPFLAGYLLQSSETQRWLGALFACTAAVCQLLFWPTPLVKGVLEQHIVPGTLLPSVTEAICYSGSFFLGAILLVGILRESVFRNNMYKIGKKPVSIAIAGDSGSGKDTCAGYLVDLLGEHSIIQISGDDYHLWDRYALMWKRFTHLSPRANDLGRFSADILDVLARKPISCRAYDHATGRFRQPAYHKSSDFVLISGLHALYQEKLNEKFDLKIFLGMDESLRVFFKCQRDTLQRGHELSSVLASIDKRRADAELYVAPQCHQADIVFTLEASSPCDLSKLELVPKLRLRVTLRRAIYAEELARWLIVLGGCSVEISPGNDPLTQMLLIEGNCPAGQIGFIAARMLPMLDEILCLKPAWRDGLDGVMQLVMLCHMMQNCKER